MIYLYGIKVTCYPYMYTEEEEKGALNRLVGRRRGWLGVLCKGGDNIAQNERRENKVT